MQFPTPLLPGKLIKRYKRFLADIELDDGTEITAHCANPGSMLTLKEPGSRVYVSKVPDNVDRKLRYDWQIIEDLETGKPVGINTNLPNKLVKEALEAKVIKEVADYSVIKSEVKYGTQNSRVDFLLEDESMPPCYLEVKNVNHREQGSTVVQFPDAVTARGTKHLQELAGVIEQGARAIVLYVVQREDCTHFDVAKQIDPTYAQTSEEVKKRGVEFLCYTCAVSPDGITLDKPLPIK